MTSRCGCSGFLSPVVRRLLDEHGLAPDQVVGSGDGGRITPRRRPGGRRLPRSGGRPRSSAPAAAAVAPVELGRIVPAGIVARDDDDVIEFAEARRNTATNMLRSLAISAHTLVVTEVDYTAIDGVRRKAKLSFLPFVARAVIDAIGEFPNVNASVGDDELIVHRNVNLGFAVDVDHQALVVPVLKGARQLRLRAISDGVTDLAARARGQAAHDGRPHGRDVHHHKRGSYGTLITAPVINQPEVAILSTDGVKMRPVAVRSAAGEWTVTVHPVGNLCLSFDHRAFDGAYASAFLAEVRSILENADWTHGGVTMAITEAGAGATYRGFPVDELIDDFRLACVSRAIDDREISMQKQSRVFFQISGAGHEAVGLGLARLLRPGYDWFFPYYRDLSLVLGLGVTPTEVLMQAVGSADDPSSGARQMPSHWGSTAYNIVTQSSPTGSQCIPAVGCAEASRYIVRRDLPGCTAEGDELTYVSLGEGATSEGEFWESLNTACNLHLPGAVPGGRQRLRHLRARPRPGPGPGGRAGQRLPRARRPPHGRHRLLRGASHAGARSSSSSAPAPAPPSSTPTSPAPTRTRRPTRRPSTAPPPSWPRRPSTIPSCASRPSSSPAACSRPTGPPRSGPRPRTSWPGPPPRRWRRPAPTPAGHRARVRAARHPRPPTPTTAATGCHWARPSSARCTSRWRPTSASGSSARTWPTPTRRCSTASRARVACSAPPTGCSAPSVRPAASTRR